MQLWKHLTDMLENLGGHVKNISNSYKNIFGGKKFQICNLFTNFLKIYENLKNDHFFEKRFFEEKNFFSHQPKSCIACDTPDIFPRFLLQTASF